VNSTFSHVFLKRVIYWTSHVHQNWYPSEEEADTVSTWPLQTEASIYIHMMSAVHRLWMQVNFTERQKTGISIHSATSLYGRKHKQLLKSVPH